MQLGLLKSLFVDSLSSNYSFDEAEAIFYIVLDHIEQKNRTNVLFGENTFFKEKYLEVLEELIQGKPIQYILGEAPFYGLVLSVNEHTLIPRPETEELVDWIINENKNGAPKILDIGTGSGCIALALKSNLPNAKLYACDNSKNALEVATNNAQQQNLDIHFFGCNILEEELSSYDIVVSNPPYIAQSEKVNMHQNVVDYEPSMALFVEDQDSLIFYKTIIQKVRSFQPILYFETSEFYHTQLTEWLQMQNLRFIWKTDFQGKNRMLKVWW